MTADAQAVRVPLPALLTPEQAWTYLGISKPKLYELTRAGELAYVQLPARTGRDGNGDRRYELRELDRFIEAHRTAGGPAAHRAT